jgi:hypothetical protein
VPSLDRAKAIAAVAAAFGPWMLAGSGPPEPTGTPADPAELAAAASAAASAAACSCRAIRLAVEQALDVGQAAGRLHLQGGDGDAVVGRGGGHGAGLQRGGLVHGGGQVVRAHHRPDGLGPLEHVAGGAAAQHRGDETELATAHVEGPGPVGHRVPGALRLSGDARGLVAGGQLGADGLLQLVLDAVVPLDRDRLLDLQLSQLVAQLHRLLAGVVQRGAGVGRLAGHEGGHQREAEPESGNPRRVPHQGSAGADPPEVAVLNVSTGR